MVWFAQGLPLLLALAYPDVEAFTPKNFYLNSLRPENEDQRKVALDDEVLEGPFLTNDSGSRKSLSGPEVSDNPMLSSYLNNISNGSPEKKKPSGGGAMGSYLDNLSNDPKPFEDEADAMMSDLDRLSGKEATKDESPPAPVPETPKEPVITNVATTGKTPEPQSMKESVPSSEQTGSSYLDALSGSPTEANKPREKPAVAASSLDNLADVPSSAKSDTNAAPATGSYSDNLSGYSSSSAAPKVEKKLGMGSHLDNLSGPSSSATPKVEKKAAEPTMRSYQEALSRLSSPAAPKDEKRPGSHLDHLSGSPLSAATKDEKKPGLGSHLDNLSGSSLSAAPKVENKPGMGSHLDNLSGSPSSAATQVENKPGMGSHLDHLSGSPSSTAPKVEKKAVEPTKGAYQDTLSGSSSPATPKVEKKPGLGSHLDNLSGSSAPKVEKKAAEPKMGSSFENSSGSSVAPKVETKAGMGSHLDDLSGSSSSAAPKLERKPGMGSHLDHLSGPSSTTPKVEKKPGMGSHLDNLSGSSSSTLPKVEKKPGMGSNLNNWSGSSSSTPPKVEKKPAFVAKGSTKDTLPKSHASSTLPKSSVSVPDVAVPDVESARDDAEEISLEERIAASMAEAKAIGETKAAFMSTRKHLIDSKSRTQQRLSRAAYEKRRAEEKIANLQAEAKAVERRLEAKLDDNQSKIDSEVNRIVDLLTSEIQQEVTREEQIVRLTNTLQEAIVSKEDDIALEEKTTEEMIDVQSQLKPGVIRDNLNGLVEQKKKILAIEKELVKDLRECLVELQAVLEDVRARASSTKATLSRLARPEVRASSPYEWSDLEEVEQTLDQAADTVAASEKRISEISLRIDDALVKGVLVLGEEVPPGLAAAAKRAIARNIEKLKEKDEEELVTMLTNSAGAATVDGSKAVLYGLKALLDVTGEPMLNAAKTIVNEASSHVQNGPPKELPPKLPPQDASIGETVKSTASVLGSVGKAGSAIMKKFGQTDAARAAADALKQTSKNVLQCINLLAALSEKLLDKYKKHIKENQGKE